MANLKINKDSVIFVKRSFYGKGFYENGNAESKYVIVRRKQEPKQPPEVFFKKDVLKKFRKFHRKTPVLERLLIQLQVLGLYEKEAQHSCFSVKFTKYLRNTYLRTTVFTGSNYRKKPDDGVSLLKGKHLFY